MATHHLYLTNDKLVCIVKRGEAQIAHERFPTAELDGPALYSHLSKYAFYPTHVYVDLLEEDFRLDTVPHLRGGDQEAVLERKMSQLYRGTPFKHAVIQGREEEGRRDDRVFFHALTNPDLLKQLLTVLETRQIPLESVSSSPVLSPILLRELELAFPHTLLVSIVPDFGLRQTYIQGKLVKFSRITPISYDEGQSVGSLIAAETSRTWQYLDSLRFFTSEDTLEVCILVHNRDREMIADAIRSYPLLHFRFLEMGEVAAKLKLKEVPTSSHADALLVHLFSKARPENHYASKEQRRFGLYRKARIALFALTAVVLAAGIGVTGFNFAQGKFIADRIENRSLDERRMLNEYQDVSRIIRAQKFATEAVRDSAIFYNSQIRPEPSSPGPLMRELSQVITGFPNISLEKLTWAVSNDPNSAVNSGIPSAPTGLRGITSGAGMIDAPVPAQGAAPAKSGEPTAGSVLQSLRAGAATPITEAPRPATPGVQIAASDINPPLAGNKYQHLIIEASLRDATISLRAALEEIERLRVKLALIENTNVTVSQLPVDSGPNARLKVENTGSRVPRFMLRVTQKVKGT